MVEVASQTIGGNVDSAINIEEAVDYPHGKEFGLYSMAYAQISPRWIKGTKPNLLCCHHFKTIFPFSLCHF